MKLKLALFLAATAATGLMAQTGGNPPSPLPAIPAPMPPAEISPAASTNAPPAKPVKAKKKARKEGHKAASEKKAAVFPEAKSNFPPLTNGLATAKQDNVNVRGKADINSEVVAHLKRGETITVLEEITLKHPKADEPSRWAKIALPASAHAWVNSGFLDTNHVVSTKKLNVRTGPGENFSVSGLLHKGDAVKEVRAKGDWTEIEPPEGAFAFVASHLLAPKAGGAGPTIEKPEAAPATTPPVVANNPTTIPPLPPIAPPPSTTPENSTPTPTPAPVPAAVPLVSVPVPAPLPEPAPEDTGPRVIQREGIVRDTVSIQAPSYFELVNLVNGRTMDYLYTTSTNVVLKRYHGMTVLVTGEEALDERWPNTPVLTIQRIQVVK